jgi:hypothetical protein
LRRILGAGNQEAYQLLQNANGIAYGLAYRAMFAIPLVAPGEKPSWMLRVAAVSGFAMTLLYVILSVFPILDVPNALSFAVEISGLVIGLNLAEALFYLERGDPVKARAGTNGPSRETQCFHAQRGDQHLKKERP